MIAHVNGIDIFYEKTGSGRPLVMVHGNSEDHTIFDKAADLLKDDFTVYCVDSRGHGQSSPVDEFHYDDMAEDMIAFMEELDLNDVIFYGFSDGGIIGLLAASKCRRITDLIVSGANMTPNGVKTGLVLVIRALYKFKKDPKMWLMLNEPHIEKDTLSKITARTLVLAGSKDLVKEKETLQIAYGVPGAQVKILKGEGHGSYIVHKEKIGELIRDFVLNR